MGLFQSRFRSTHVYPTPTIVSVALISCHQALCRYLAAIVLREAASDLPNANHYIRLTKVSLPWYYTNSAVVLLCLLVTKGWIKNLENSTIQVNTSDIIWKVVKLVKMIDQESVLREWCRLSQHNQRRTFSFLFCFLDGRKLVMHVWNS